MIPRDQSVVVLEIQPLISMLIVESLEALGYSRIHAFDEDVKAAEFIFNNPATIVGVIQNTQRYCASSKLPHHITGRRNHSPFASALPLDSGPFYLNVIDLFIPWANVIFATGWDGSRETRNEFELRHNSERYWEGQAIRKNQEGRRIIDDWSARDPRIAVVEKPFDLDELGVAIGRWMVPDTLTLDHKARLLQPVNEEVAMIFSRHPELMLSMDPRKFEEFIAFVFKNHGFETELTAATRDGGYDIRAVRADRANEVMLIEVKRYALHRGVGVGVVRALYGVKHLLNASKVVLVTSSFVSRDARKQFSRTIPHELEIWDYDRLRQFCADYAADIFEL